MTDQQVLLDEAVTQQLADMMGEAMAMLLDQFVETVETAVTEIQEEYQVGNADEVFPKAHTFKSLSAQFGAQPLSDLFKEIEHAARHGDLQSVSQQVTDLPEMTTNTLTQIADYRTRQGI